MDSSKSKFTTASLMKKLFKSNDIKEFIEQNEDILKMPVFHEYIQNKCKEINEIPEKIILKSGLDRVYGHQIFQGIRKPSRDKVIQLAFGFELNVDETQELLKIACKNLLHPKIKRDAAIIFCLERKKGFIETQMMLDELQLEILSGNKLDK